MHPNQARPIPLPPLHAYAWGTRPAALDTKAYFNDLKTALDWAEGQAGVDTVLIEDTIDQFPYRANGRIYKKSSPGVWLCDRT